MTIKQLAKVILLLGMGLFLASRLWNGTLNFYIHPRFNTLTLLTAVTLILLGIAYAVHQQRTQSQTAAVGNGRAAHAVNWFGLLLLALPILFGLAVAPTPLGAAALANRDVNVNAFTSARAPQDENLTTIALSGEKNIIDWLYEFQRRGDPAAFDGQEASIIGFVYRDDRFAADTFMVSRFTISCCVADAAPVGLIVQWPDAAALPADGWVEVNGRFQTGSFNGQSMPLLIADTVAPTEPPAQPYLYP